MSDLSRELSACECPICFSYLVGNKTPMFLPCGHTLCSVCVAKMKEKRKEGHQSFPCPICRKLIREDSVSLNVTLKNLIEELTVENGKRGDTTLNVPYHEISLGDALDRGAFGEVYRGSWRGNEVAVKVFTVGQMIGAALQAFKREVFVMNCLRHPNVVLMMGACQNSPKLAILMEYVPGGSLHKVLYIEKINMTLEGVCRVGGDICRGLQYLHSINVVHRDLKSKNVLLTSAPPLCQAKLCDFGMARVRLESATMTGNIGTVHWTAPEVLANKRYQFPADVYGLGMVIYEMVTGLVPFHELIPVAVIMAVAINKERPKIPDFVNPIIADLINRCVSWEPDQRPPVADVLHSFVDLLPLKAVTSHQEDNFSHKDSLGMVFLSVSDSDDVGIEVTTNKEGMVTPNEEGIVTASEEGVVTDSDLAHQLQLKEKEFQLKQDAYLAQQLQFKENSYLTPINTKIRPSEQTVDAKSMKTSVQYTSASQPFPPPLPPPPPPPPPLPPPPLLATNVLYHRIIEQVRKYAGHLRHKLHPVNTVEKSAFRVGRVVDGSNSERSQFTVQNQILSFNIKLLRHVPAVEPSTPFPLGKVVPTSSQRVDFLRSRFQS